MADCIAGFPHGGAISDIGGFLSQRMGGGSGELDTNYGVPIGYGDNPFGYPIIPYFTGAPCRWFGTQTPALGDSAFEMDVQPMWESSYYWNITWGYRTPPDPDSAPWITHNEEDLTLLVLDRKNAGHVAVWFAPVADLPTIDALIDAQDVGLDMLINDAVSAGRAARVDSVLQDGVWMRLRVDIQRPDAGTFAFSLTVYNEDATVAGASAQTGVVGVSAKPGFSSQEMVGPITYGYIGQPRLLMPDGCPLAPSIPAFEPQVVALDAPSECDTGMTSPDELYSGPFLPNFKVTVPVGDTPEKFGLSIESVCDKPMSLSGIEWTGWIFNNSRRI